MRGKKPAALLTALCLIFTVFACVPVSAAAPAERVEIVVEGESISLFDENFENYKIWRNDKIGLYSAALGWITECKWNQIEKTDIYGFYTVSGNDGIGLIDAYGKEIIAAEWDMIYFDSGIVVVCDNELYGLMDISGNVLAEPEYDYIDRFYEGIAMFYKDEKIGFINTAGRVISEPVWNDAQEFSDGAAAVKNADGLWGFIDTTGDTIIPCQFENVSLFYKGYASILENDTVYIIDKTGKKIVRNGKALEIEPSFNCHGYVDTLKFSGSQKDIACIKIKGEENFCYIDSNYDMLTESIYKYRVLFTEDDYAITIIPNRYGMEKYAVIVADRTDGITITSPLSEKDLISEVKFGEHTFFKADSRLYDITGKDLFGMAFEKYIYHYDGSDIINAVYKGQYVCVSFDGEVISPLSDYQFYYVADNLYMATADDGRVKLCDRNGKQIAETDEYAEAYAEDGLIYVKNDDGDWGIMDTDGKTVIKPQFDEIHNISQDMLKYKDNGKYGFVNMETGDIIKAKFSKTSDFKEGYCWVSEKVFIGAIDKDGNYIIDPLFWGYNDCTGFGGNGFSHGVTSLQKAKNGKFGVVNMKGEKILDFTYDYIGAFSENGIAIFDLSAEDDYDCGLMKVVGNDSEDIPTKITTDKGDIVTYVGCYDVITETVTPASAADLGVSFTSTNPAVATVDEVGRVYGVSEGNAIIVLVSHADTSVIAAVSVTVQDRELHAADDIIPISAWEEQTWLSDVVLAQLSEQGITKTAEELTYGDLLEITEINIDELADPGDDTVYHIPAIIGEFSNLIFLNIRPQIFAPLISTLPDSAKFLSNLYGTDITNTYGDEVDEYIIRNNADGIPDINLYKAMTYNNYYRVVRKGTYVSSLSLKNITDITGLSQVNTGYSSLDLSYNHITDISELENITVSDMLDLRYNNLDLEDENTLAVIQKFEESGTTVLTKGQNESDITFHHENEWSGEITRADCPDYFGISLRTESSQEQIIAPHPADAIDDFSVATTDSAVATGRFEYYRDGYYKLVCDAVGIGNATFYITRKTDGKVLYEIPVKVSDARFSIEDIDVSYSVSDWDPTHAQLNCRNDYYYLQCRKQGETAWNQYYSWDNPITENGTYEVRYCNFGGVFSNIATLEITEIKQLITEEQMPDDNLRSYLGNTLYEGKQINPFNADFKNISSIKGLSLLDFSGIYSYDTFDLSHNQITDISELANIELGECRYVDLSYNKIDFTKPANAKALAALYEKGCIVYINNQYSNEVCIKNSGSHNWGVDGKYSFNSSINIPVYPVSEAQYLTFSYGGDTVLQNIYTQTNSGGLVFGFNYGTSFGTQTVNIHYKGNIVESFDFTVYNYNSTTLDAPTVRVDGYTELQGFYIVYEDWASSYEYRKLGDSEWTSSSNSRFYITEAGTYEFRIYRNGIYSDITTKNLTTTSYNGLNMLLTDDGWKVTSVTVNDLPENLVIPETVDGYPVTEIYPLHCIGIKTVSIPKTVKHVSSIYDCSNLTSITVDAQNPYYYSKDGMLIEKGTNRLVTCPAGLSGKVTLPEGVINIDYNNSAFLGCNSITELVLPSTLERFDDSLSNLGSLTEITVASGSEHFYVEDGVLYEKYTGTLKFCPDSKTGKYTVKSGTLFIGKYAFQNSAITDITLPASLLKIDEYAFNRSNLTAIEIPFGTIFVEAQAFYGCDTLSSVTIPSSVTTIGYCAFADCSSLEKVIVPSSVTEFGHGAFGQNDTTIYCVENSPAHIYASGWDSNYVLISSVAGDIDGDGIAGASDLIALKTALIFGSSSDSCDINLDGVVDIRDLVRMKKYIANAETEENSTTAATALSAQPAYIEKKTTL